MAQSLEELIVFARKYREEHAFTAEEQERQVRSFAYGNTRLENDQITMSDIDEAMDSLKAERSRNLCLSPKA